MTKIKNFRIHFRAREMARWLKHHRQLPTTPEVELAVENIIQHAKEFIHPAAIYTTLARATAEKATSLAFPEKSVAASVIVVTVGGEIDEAIAAVVEDATREPLLTALKEEALHQAVHFSIRLLNEQAKDEECELSVPIPAEETVLLSSLSTLLGSQRIGVAMESDQTIWPSHAKLVWTYWTPMRRASGKKADSTSRAARAA